jgi:hypothetical protein
MPVISGSTSKIIASIVSTFDAKGVKQAEKSLNSFGNLSKKFGKTLGVSLSAAAVISFGKAAVDQFAKSEKAANELGMALVSVGKASEYISTQHFLSGLQDTTGILKDNLIPAMNTLLIQTKSVTESQKLLGIATDIAASGTADLQSTATALGKAYNGNLTALAKLNVGISVGEAKTNSYAKAVKYLADFYKGDGARAAETFAGKMNRVKAATFDAMQSIGSGWAEAFQTLYLNGNNSIDGLLNGIRNIGFVVGQELAGLGKSVKDIFDAIGSNPVFKLVAGYIGKSLSFLGKKTGITAAISKDIALGKAKQLADEKAKQAQLLAIEKNRLATQRASLTAAKDAAAEAKKQLILKSLGDILGGAQDLFNLDNIELAAAMMSKQTDQDMARLKLKQDIFDLEKAINAGNVTAAQAIAQTLISDAEQFAKLREASNNLSGIPDPFLGWLQTIQAMVAQMLLLSQIAATVQLGTFNVGSEFRMGESAGNAAAGLPANSLTNFMGFGDEHLSQLARMADGGVVTQATPVIAGEAGAEAIIPLDKFGGFGGGNVTVNVAGSVITQQQLLDAISQGLQNQGASGRTTTFNRLNSPYIA